MLPFHRLHVALKHGSLLVGTSRTAVQRCKTHIACSMVDNALLHLSHLATPLGTIHSSGKTIPRGQDYGAGIAAIISPHCVYSRRPLIWYKQH